MKPKIMEIRWSSLLRCIILTLMCVNCYSLGVDGADTISLGASITANQTIKSKNNTFELGFFSPNGNINWYIGIWFAQASDKTIVWVANRETPIRNIPGVLNLTRDGHLSLTDAKGVSVWLVNVTKKTSKAVILESGNFVLLGDDNKSEPVWQSFDHPVDTWLAGMRFGGQQKFVSWKNSLDPAPGIFSFQSDPSGVKQFVLRWNNSVQYSQSGIWDGKRFSEIPEPWSNTIVSNLSVEDSSFGLYITYTLMPQYRSLTRFVLDKTGAVRLYSSVDGDTWSIFWFQPRDQCSVYGFCGAYATCNPNNLQFCSCVEGFMPKDNRTWDLQEWWSSGCVRQSPLECNAKNGSTDGFMELSASLPENQASSYPAQSKKDCEKTCLSNCSCTAFSYKPLSELCQIWSGDLLHMQNSPNSEVFVRVAASALKPGPSSSSKRKTTIIIVSAFGATVALAIGLLSTFLLCRWRRSRSNEMYAEFSNALRRKFSYKELKIATWNFSNKLGSGGFGSVFKGALTDGTFVAVKKLEGSGQSEKEFRAEINSVGNIQHVNLVRLRGICAEGSERLLVYDYMSNGSLNSLLFGANSKTKRKVLDWKTRFEIALGTARGLDYLHEKCRERIIHGDVKPENILLDANFCPKLGDFGLAKLVGRDLSGVLTTTRGTRGYLAPEWISGLPITPKVDVYSFGMTLLEIISGRRNLDLQVQDSSKYYFPPWAATQIQEGNMMNIVEGIVAHDADVEEVRRACVVSMLCIQEDEIERPSMAQVLLMLEGRMEAHLPNSALMMMHQHGIQGKSNSDRMLEMLGGLSNSKESFLVKDA